MIEAVERIAAFADGGNGGNPAGVWIAEAGAETLQPAEMQRVAAEVGYSETAFAAPIDAGGWRVRYFAPEMEVPFCGHATIALGAALGRRFGAARYRLALNAAEITVEAQARAGGWGAELISPRTWSKRAESPEDAALLADFGFCPDDLAPGAPPMRAHAGADHLVWRFASLAPLERLGAEMAYPFDEVRQLMGRAGYVTVALIAEEAPGRLRARNAFAAGGVREDPATGAAAAAIAGLLRDQGALPAGGVFEIRQGVEMGAPSRLYVRAGATAGAGAHVAGACRWIS